MGGMSGQPTDNLVALAADAAERPGEWSVFALLRAFERLSPDRPRVGTALDPGREVVDVAQMPSADFPASTVSAIEHDGPRPRVRALHLGLSGPMGPLPFHFTELLLYERRGRRPRPFGDFLDLISARMLQAHHRAWAMSQPCAQLDRPADDRFATWLGATSGATNLSFGDAAERPPTDAPGFSEWRRLAYGGQLAGLRSASAVADMLGHLLGCHVRVTEWVARWREIPLLERTRIGARLGGANGLGAGAVLGGRFRAVEWDVEIVVAAGDMRGVQALLPGTPLHRLLAEAARAALPAHLDWSARIELPARAVAPARLARRGEGARLGWTSWLGTRGVAEGVRRDTRLRPKRVSGGKTA
jgi:type VI secretion system protein ImpH